MCPYSFARVLRKSFALMLLGFILGPAFVSNAMAAGPWQLGASLLSLADKDQRLLRLAADGRLSNRLRVYQLRRDKLSSIRRTKGNTESVKSEQSSNTPKRPKSRAEAPKCIGGRIMDGACRCLREARLSDGICVAVNPRPSPDTPRQPGRPLLANPSPLLVAKPSPVTNTPQFSPPNIPPAGGAAPSLPTPPILNDSLPFVADEVLAVLAAATPENVEADAAARYNLLLLERATLPLLAQRVVRFRIPDGRSVATVTASLTGDAMLGTAQPNFIYRPQQAPAAPLQAPLQYAVAKVDLAAARSLSVGRGAIVAVIDTGIDTAHEDLRGSDIQTFDTTGSHAAKPDMHGTAIAGIISARGLLEGIAPAARLIGIRAFASTPAGTQQYSTSVMVLKAMDLAITQHAQVINLSFAGVADPLMQKAVGAVAGRGTIMVAAAGNNGHQAPPCYPAAYPEVIAVTAVDADDRLYAQANVGAYVAIAAPGVDVLVPTPGNSRDLESGTSFAAAHVTGIVALMLERNSRLTSAQARTALTGGAVSLSNLGPDAEFGAGRVNAAASLRLVSTGIEK